MSNDYYANREPTYLMIMSRGVETFIAAGTEPVAWQCPVCETLYRSEAGALACIRNTHGVVTNYQSVELP